MAGRIIIAPKALKYPYPKAVGVGESTGKVLGRAMVLEKVQGLGYYMRILDLVSWNKQLRELRFTYYYRKVDIEAYNDENMDRNEWLKARCAEKHWIYGQGAGHMTSESFYRLLKKAKSDPIFGNFENSLEKVVV